MSQINDGVRALLGVPKLYQMFNRLIGNRSRFSAFVEQQLRIKQGDRVLDIGCGTGDILADLPPVEYTGFDMSREYIDAAKKRYGSRGTFHCQRLDSSTTFPTESFDVVLAMGVLHHLDDSEAIDLFRLAARALKLGGRLVTIDGCYVTGQSPIARYLLSRDRGQNVRTEQGYLGLAGHVFSAVSATVTHDLLRVPYTHIALACTRQ